MSHRLTTMMALAAVAAMTGAAAPSGPAEARDLIIVDGPIKANDLKCKRCVKRRALRENAVSSDKMMKDSVTHEKMGDDAVGTDEVQDGAITAEKLDPALLDALSGSSSTFYIVLDGDGATETIATQGPLTYFARCRVDQGDNEYYRSSFDRIEIVATSSQDGWFEEDYGEGSGGPLEAGMEVIANSHSVYPTGTMAYDNLSETSIVAPDGSYLGLEGDAGGLGLNLFGHDCIAIGNIYRATGAL